MKMVICKNTIFEVQRWHTFGEVIKRTEVRITEDDVGYIEPYTPFLATSMKAFVGAFCSQYFIKTDTTEQAIIDKLVIEIYARFYDHFVFSTKEKIVENNQYSQEYRDKFQLLITRYTSIFNNTYDRYMNLLKIYQNQLSTLLDKVKTKSTGVGKFNDTPQNEIVNGDEFGDGGHISNITKSENETETDFDTKMGRIDEIQRKLKNILREWTDEFSGLFIESENF